MNELFINGQWMEAQGRKRYELVNPATEELITTFPFAGNADCLAAIGHAETAFEQWGRTTPYFRAEILKKTADFIRKDIDILARDMVLESGKPLLEARGEWMVAANLFEWYGEEAKRAYGKVIPTNRLDKRSSVIWQPIGVVGVITAWNFPAYNPARSWAAALAAGCTVVAKPSENTPLSAAHMASGLSASGLPPGVLNLLVGDAAAIGDAMLDHPGLRKISFTGSTRVGKILMDGASRTHTRLSLELGGNAPVIVFGDVDVEAVAKAASGARFRNNGQVCTAPQRFYVHESIFKSFAESMTRQVSAMQLGSGFDEGVQLGPLITQKQRDSVLEVVRQVREEKASILTGGDVPADRQKGYFIRPAVVIDLKDDSILATKEIFGPVLPLFSFSTLDEVIGKANSTEYGLSAYVFTNDLKTAIHASERLNFGIVGINEWAPHGTELPFGGWKQSGQGHESGSEGLFEYMEKKLISIGGL